MVGQNVNCQTFFGGRKDKIRSMSIVGATQQVYVQREYKTPPSRIYSHTLHFQPRVTLQRSHTMPMLPIFLHHGGLERRAARFDFQASYLRKGFASLAWASSTEQRLSAA